MLNSSSSFWFAETWDELLHVKELNEELEDGSIADVELELEELSVEEPVPDELTWDEEIEEENPGNSDENEDDIEDTDWLVSDSSSDTVGPTSSLVFTGITELDSF